MQRFRTARWILLALLLTVIPVSSAHAGVFISVGIAPPLLPVYVQPPCPEPNMIWTPGYWAYDYDMQQYYWVPGAWVPAPYEGAMWTPPYWGFDDGAYLFHAGYWGPVVGYYGGINYGFGYMGVGFVGGEWHEHHFFYNTAIVNVNRTYIHNTYINNTVVREHTIVNNNHIAFNGGPRGIQHMPTPEERSAMQMPHNAPTRFQQQHIQEARYNRANFFNQNHGRPQMAALSRPLAAEHVQPPTNMRSGMARNGGVTGGTPVEGNRGMQTFNRPQSNRQPMVRENGNAHITAMPNYQQQQRGFSNAQPAQRGFGNSQPQRPESVQRGMVNPQPVQRGFGNMQPQRPQQPQVRYQAPQQPQYRQAPQPRFEQPQQRPMPQYRPEQSRPQPQYRPQPQVQYHPQPQQQPRFEQARPQAMPSYRPTPQPRVQAAPAYHPAPQPQFRPAPQPQYHSAPQPQPRPAPQPRPEGRPHR